MYTVALFTFVHHLKQHKYPLKCGRNLDINCSVRYYNKCFVGDKKERSTKT